MEHFFFPDTSAPQSTGQNGTHNKPAQHASCGTCDHTQPSVAASSAPPEQYHSPRQSGRRRCHPLPVCINASEDGRREGGNEHKSNLTVPCQVRVFLGHRPHYALHPWARENGLGDTERRHLECSGFQLTGRVVGDWRWGRWAGRGG